MKDVATEFDWTEFDRLGDEFLAAFIRNDLDQMEIILERRAAILIESKNTS